MRIPVANTSALASPPTQPLPLKTRSRASTSGPVVSRSSGERYTGCDSPVSVERSISSAALEQAGVGRDAVALREQEHVAGTRLGRVDSRAVRRRGSTFASTGR